MTLLEFYDELDKHDWYYMFSDDMGVYNRGRKYYDRLLKIAEFSGNEYRNLFYEFKDYIQDRGKKPSKDMVRVRASKVWKAMHGEE